MMILGIFGLVSRNRDFFYSGGLFEAQRVKLMRLVRSFRHPDFLRLSACLRMAVQYPT
jgi:hypothetical protein